MLLLWDVMLLRDGGVVTGGGVGNGLSAGRAHDAYPDVVGVLLWMLQVMLLWMLLPLLRGRHAVSLLLLMLLATAIAAARHERAGLRVEHAAAPFFRLMLPLTMLLLPVEKLLLFLLLL